MSSIKVRNTMRLLVVEDEKDLNDIIVRRLRDSKYCVDACFDGLEALDYIAMAEYDTIILDVMLPGLSGLEILRRLRQKDNKVPVLLLTAKDSIEDRVKGLDSGADDYLIKPFAFDELLARIRVLTRRNGNQVSNLLSVGDLTMDIESHVVKRGGKVIPLSSKEFAVLEYMMHNQGVVLSRGKMEQHIWNYDYEGGSNVIDVYIRYLRRKIDSDYSTKLIHTIRGAGYVLREEKNEE